MNFTNAAIIIVIVALIWFIWPENVLYGFWTASDAYCNEADLTSMILYFGPKRWWSRPAYMVIQRGGREIINSSFIARISWRPFSTYNITFEDLDADGFPTHQRITMDADGMRFLLHDGDTLYGEFYRDLETNHIIKSELST